MLRFSQMLLAGIPAGLLALALACAGGLGGGDFHILPFWVRDHVVATDLNGDGRPDVAVVATYIDAGAHTDSVEVYLQSASGGFEPPVRYPVARGPWGLCAGDLDGDGRPDLIVLSPSTEPPQDGVPGNSGGLSVLRQDPAMPGRFLPAVWVPTGGVAETAAIMDVTGDGLPDVVVGDGVNLNSRILVLAQAPGQPGVLLPPVAVPMGTGHGMVDMVVADVNGDGLPDLVVSGYDRVVVLYRLAGGGFAPPVFLGSGFRINSVAAADLDGDGRMDLVAAHTRDLLAVDRGSSTVLVFRQTQPGLFTLAQIPVVGSFEQVAIADLNGDGLLDLAALSTDGTAKVTVFLQSSVQPGTFSAFGSFAGPSMAEFFALGDLDGDGRTEVILSEGPSVMRQTDPGVFGPPRPLR